MGLKAEGDQNLQIVFLFNPGACFSRPGKVGILTHPGVNFGEFASVLAVSSPGGSWVLCCGVGRMCKHGRQANRSCDAARTQLARDDCHLRKELLE
jgi:hypothetical protein